MVVHIKIPGSAWEQVNLHRYVLGRVHEELDKVRKTPSEEIKESIIERLVGEISSNNFLPECKYDLGNIVREEVYRVAKCYPKYKPKVPLISNWPILAYR